MNRDHDHAPKPQDPDELTVADVIGEKYPTPDQLASHHSRDELRTSLTQLTHQETELGAEIALLETKRKRVRGEKLITEQALRIVADQGLE